MKKLYIILIVLITTILTGCGNSKTKHTDKVTNIFQHTTGDFQSFTGQTDTQFIKMEKNKHNYIKIIDTNDTFQSYGSELNQSFQAWGDRESFLPLQSQDINFEIDRLFIVGMFGYAGNGYKEDIYLISDEKARLIIKKRPYDGLLEPKSAFFTIFAYTANRDIKTLHLNDIIIDLNDTTYY